MGEALRNSLSKKKMEKKPPVLQKKNVALCLQPPARQKDYFT